MSLCKKPFKSFDCGQCIYCRVKKKQDKANRIMLEASQHEKSSFVTLTYDDENLPFDCSLQPDDLKYFLMRLRTHISPLRIRYFACGEYGGRLFDSPKAERLINPHYHLAIFGLDYTDSEIIKKAWGKGLVDVKFLEPASALYLAKYVTKKMTGKEDERLRVNGETLLHPEFQRQSLKPGLGAGAMQPIANSLNTPYGLALIDQKGDVPNEISYQNKKVFLGRYLKTKLRQMLGFQNINAQEGWQTQMLQKQKEENHEILKKAEKQNINPGQYKKDIINSKRQRIDLKITQNKGKEKL